MNKIKRMEKIKKSEDISNTPKPKSEKYVSTGVNDLFENPRVKAAYESLSPAEKARYTSIGEQLYDSVDFEECNVNEPMLEATAYIQNQLKSGLHPSMMEQNEKDLMKESYGEEWYIKYGYVKEDLDDLVTLMPELL